MKYKYTGTGKIRVLAQILEHGDIIDISEKEYLKEYLDKRKFERIEEKEIKKQEKIVKKGE